MKKKLLSLTVAAALAGAASSAQAVSINNDGLGEVLFYPFYTVEDGQSTYINLVNTTGNYKAVKVRFREAMNSREVLDFNLYLSPYDHWSGVVLDDGNGGAAIKTADTSCTVPNVLAATSETTAGPAISFRSDEYAEDSINGIERTREGYVEIIEMAELVDTRPANVNLTTGGIKHTNGVPADCSRVEAAWVAGGAFVTPPAGLTVTEPTGGLYGYGVLINVAEGTDATYDAIALDDFYNDPTTSLHVTIGTESPGLNDANPAEAQYLDNDGAIQTADFSGGPLAGIYAVSALMAHTAIANDYVLEPTIKAGTDWVITFPTKKDLVNGAPYNATTGSYTADVPFTTGWNTKKSQACEKIEITYFDREERENVSAIDFSPKRTTENSLCFEANVLTFNGSNVLSGSSRVSNNLNVDFDNGWARIGFADAAYAFSNNTDRSVLTGSGESVFRGLPVTGFAVQKYVNGDLNGVLSNYAGSVTHKTSSNRAVNP